MNIHDEFTRRVAEDRLCAAVMKAVRENDTAALGRLGMRGFGLYAGRLSELMTECARRRLLGADDFGAIMDEDEDEDDFGAIMDEDEDEDEDDFGAIMNEVAKPAHYAHHLVNEGGTAIQQALDRQNGVRLRVIEPEFNDGRLKGIVGEASESDSENAADNLATQLGTFVKDMGNEFMRQNAEQRDRAGFKVTITRTGGAKCCPWCADRTGKWELANAPDGVFGCHDNCKCMVDYTNSKGTVRGRAVTHKIDGKTVTKWDFADKIPYTPPKVLTREEAAARGGFDKPKRLTGGANGGIIELDIKKLLMQKIADGEISTQINPEVQNRHFLGTKERQEFLDRGIEKSYFLHGVTLEMLQDFLSKKVGTGKLYINRKGNIEEIFNFGKDVAYDTMWNRKTQYMKVLYSKKRTHFFPYSPLGGEIE